MRSLPGTPRRRHLITDAAAAKEPSLGLAVFRDGSANGSAFCSEVL